MITVGLNTIGGSFPVWALVLIIGVALSLLVFFTSKNDQQPKYHPVIIMFTYIIICIYINFYILSYIWGNCLFSFALWKTLHKLNSQILNYFSIWLFLVSAICLCGFCGGCRLDLLCGQWGRQYITGIKLSPALSHSFH